MLRWLLGTTKPLRYAVEDWLFRRSDESRHLITLKDRYRGRPLLIVGNGPSLNRTPLAAFAGVPSIGMNKIDLLFSRSAWRPDLILVTNNLVVRQHAKAFNASDIPVYIGWKGRWFLRGRRGRNVHFFNITGSEAFSTNAAVAVGSGATVTYAALQFAYYLGADPVIIVGVDHNFDRTAGAHVYEKRVGADVNHFDPNYFAGGTYWGVPNMDASEAVFARARAAFEADGRRVLDATIDGKLQVFEKIGIDEAIGLATAAQPKAPGR